jgi:hypothetical protein
MSMWTILRFCRDLHRRLDVDRDTAGAVHTVACAAKGGAAPAPLTYARMPMTGFL